VTVGRVGAKEWGGGGVLHRWSLCPLLASAETAAAERDGDQPPNGFRAQSECLIIKPICFPYKQMLPNNECVWSQLLPILSVQLSPTP
jgi:hypothetical protein